MKKILFILFIFSFLINIAKVFSQENGKLLLRTKVYPDGVGDCFPEHTNIYFKLENLTDEELIFDGEIDSFEIVNIIYNNFQYNIPASFKTTYNLEGTYPYCSETKDIEFEYSDASDEGIWNVEDTWIDSHVIEMTYGFSIQEFEGFSITNGEIFNEKDTVKLKLLKPGVHSVKFQRRYRYRDNESLWQPWNNWENFNIEDSNGSTIELSDILNFITVSNLAQVEYRCFAFRLSGDDELNSDTVYSSIFVYPRRPIITNTTKTAPSCNGAGDGTITINSIDGALGEGTGEGSVSKYKISFAKGACPHTLSGNLDNIISGLGNAAMPFKAENNTISYIDDLSSPITYTVDSFFQDTTTQDVYTNPIEGGSSYCILLENFYIVPGDTGNVGFSNGCVFKTVTIPQKDPLNAVINTKNADCNGESNGSITVGASGGNLEYKLHLYKPDGTMINESMESGGSITFTGLLAFENYKVKIMDEKGCDVYYNDNNLDTNLIESIIVSQPDSLKTDIIYKPLKNRVWCKGDSTATISFTVTGGTQFKESNSGTTQDSTTYKFYLEKDGLNFNKDTLPLYNTSYTDSIFPAGLYKLHVFDAKNCPVYFTNAFYTNNTTDTFRIIEPDNKLKADTDIVYHNSFAISCHGKNDGYLTLIVSGGNGEYKYKKEQNSFVSDPVFTNLSAKNYTFYVTDASYEKTENYCIDSVSVTLTEPDTLIINNITLNNYNGFNIRCKGDNDTIFVSATGGIPRYSFGFSNNTNDTAGILITNKGTKQIWVKDINECTDSATIELSEPESLPQIDSVSTVKYNNYHVPCFGDTTGQITIHANKNSGTTTPNKPFMYSADNGENFYPDSLFTGLSSGQYILIIKDANNCLQNYSYDITQPELLQITAAAQTFNNSPYNISCNGMNDGKIFLNASGGVISNYYFYFNNELSNDTIENLHAGNYYFFVKDKNNCISDTNNIILTEPEILTFSVDTNNYNGYAIRCNNFQDSIKIIPLGGFGSLDENNNGFYKVFVNNEFKENIQHGDSSVYLPLSAETNYKFTVIDANNCKDSIFNFSVSQPEKLHIEMHDTIQTQCFNTDDGKIIIKWAGGINSTENTYDYFLIKDTLIQTKENINIDDTVTFSNISPYVQYKIKVKDNNNCNDSTYLFVKSPSEIKKSFTDIQNPLCFGDTFGIFTVSGTGGTTNNPGYYDFYIKTSYGDSVFIDNVSTAIFENVGLGIHNYFIMDDNDCLSDSATFEITEPEEMTINITSGNVSAQGGSDGYATAIVQGGTGSYSYYKWRNSDDIIIAEDVPSITGQAAGDYSVEVWDSNNCPYGNSSTGLLKYFTIYEPGQTLELYIIKQTNVSAPGGNDGSVSLDANGGWNQKTYKIGQNGTYTAANIFTGLSAGNYWFYVTDGFSVDSIQTEITEAEALLIDNITVQNITCNGNTDGTAAIFVSGGTLPYLFSLDNINFSENNIFENLDAGTYTAYVKDLYGNETNQTFSISQPDVLNMTVIDTENTLCGQSNGSATVSAQGGTPPYIYDWYLNNEHIGQYNATAENLEAGLYTVIITDANSCTAAKQITIYNSNGPEIENITTTDALCYNTAEGTATISNISASGAYTIEWSTGQTNVMNINNLEPGNYSVEVIDENECSVTETFTIEAPDKLNFNFNTNSPACFNACNGNIIANLSGGTTPYILEWQNITGNPTTNYVGNLCADEYILHVTDAHNCFYADTAYLENPEQILILDENQATICQGQSITLDAGNPGSTYQWTSDNGFQSNERSITINDAGHYYISVYLPTGCVAEDEFTLNISNSYLQANFLMQSEAEVADTVVLVEISWEAPDSVSWNIPDELWILSQSEENVQIIPTKNGTYTVALTAYLGSCSDYIEKQITITGNSDKKSQTKPEYSSDKIMQFKSINLYPNPNNGNFTLNISLYEKDDIQVEVYDILGQMQQVHKIGKGEKNYTFDFNINNLNNGLYFISIKTNKGSAGIKFLKQ